MLIRVPDYYYNFKCLAGACPHSCCEKWEVVIDEEHVCAYQRVSGSLGDKLRAAMQTDEDGDICFPLNGGRCPFLDKENLCEIHRQLGEEATSVTCQEHPRFTEDYGVFREITLSASCPAALALLLGSNAPLTFTESETGEPAEEGDEWLPFLLPLRTRMLDILRDRSLPLRTRLRRFLLLAMEAQQYLDRDEAEALPALAASWQPEESGEGDTDEASLLPAALRMLASLEILEEDWLRLLAQAEASEQTAVSQTLLERIAVYFGFRYLLKCVNDGDLLSCAQFCIFAVLTVEQLAAVCGLEEALRRFSCEIEHNEENIDALLEAFRWEDSFSPAAFLGELRT